ncbi:uncharacterized protein LOC100827432 isoform X2 [Brachypodium distachyon]|uniref:uncharacterized protein LOC100827432 isoform X2 n=1 Tax=Brachypodium distachyon TaxID=15368 RepID=UPI00071C7BEF|nr:uncharacterized protein LOC100827432 isoform X2 [Brachypodium distachyon]|eukprot:XP_014751066.1 uncharacterized protein LOC100827432 isoform X2 [Brachypodium distachyon]
MSEFHLIGLVRRGHWSDGIKYLSRFLPSERLLGVHGRALFHFLRVYQAIDYIFCGAREAVAVAAAVSVCRERLGTTSSHGLSKLCGILSSLLESKRLRDSMNILSVRHQAFLVIIDLVRQTPELKDCRRRKCGGSMNPQNVLPLGFGHASFRPRRHVKKGGARVPASLVAGLYLQKKKMLPSSTPSDHSQGLTRESLIKAKEWLVDLVDRSLEAGRPRQGEPFHSACNEAPQTVFGTFRRPARNSYLSTLGLKKEAREWMLYLSDECLEAWPQVPYFDDPGAFAPGISEIMPDTSKKPAENLARS